MLHDSPYKGVGMYLVNITSFSIISGLVKELSLQNTIQELLFVRFFCTFCFIAFFLRNAGGIRLLTTDRLFDHLIRSLSGIIAIGFWFFAVSESNLAEVTALTFSAPLFIVVLSYPILLEKLTLPKLLAVITGFTGVLLITRPGFQFFKLELYAALGSAFFFSIVSIWLRRLNSTEHPLCISIYYNLIGSLIFFVWSWLNGWTIFNSEKYFLLFFLGFLAGIQQIFLTYSFRYAEASLLAPLDFLSLPLAILIGFMFWNEMPNALSILGSLIILSSGFLLFSKEGKNVLIKCGLAVFKKRYAYKKKIEY